MFSGDLRILDLVPNRQTNHRLKNEGRNKIIQKKREIKQGCTEVQKEGGQEGWKKKEEALYYSDFISIIASKLSESE